MTYMVRSICAWCNRVEDEPVPSAINKPSHGICKPCADRVRATALVARKEMRRHA